MEEQRQNAKEKNIAKDLIIGIGGLLISDVTVNSLKDLVRKVCHRIIDIFIH